MDKISVTRDFNDYFTESDPPGSLETNSPLTRGVASRSQHLVGNVGHRKLCFRQPALRRFQPPGGLIR